MIQFRLPLDGIYNTITRPISISIINDIKDLLYLDHDIRSKLSNAIDDYVTNEQYDPIMLEANSSRVEDIHFSVEETVNEETLLTTALKYNEYKPVIFDTDVKALVRPIYVDTNLTFNIKYRSKSKTTLNNMLNSLRLRMADNQGLTLHNIGYTFYLKPEILELFLDIAKLKNNVVPTTGGFEDYLIKHSDGRLTIVGGLDGNSNTMDIAVKEMQMNINGFFTTDIVSVKGEYGSDTGMWEAQLTYHVTYNKPSAIFIQYPPLIYNQLLPVCYLVTTPGKMVGQDEYRINGTETNKNMSQLMDGNLLSKTTDFSKKVNGEMYNIPEFDRYVHKTPAPHYAPVFSVLISITPEDKRTLLNLNELGNARITDILMEFIKETEYRYMTKAYKSIIYLEIIDDDGEGVMDTIVCDKDLNVSSIADLDITKTYRVVFSIITDILMVTSDAASRTLSNKEMYNVALDALSIKDKPYTNTDRDMKLIAYNKPVKDIPYTVMLNTILAIQK